MFSFARTRYRQPKTFLKYISPTYLFPVGSINVHVDIFKQIRLSTRNWCQTTKQQVLLKASFPVHVGLVLFGQVCLCEYQTLVREYCSEGVRRVKETRNRRIMYIRVAKAIGVHCTYNTVQRTSQKEIIETCTFFFFFTNFSAFSGI